jgi:maleylacetate reductase
VVLRQAQDASLRQAQDTALSFVHDTLGQRVILQAGGAQRYLVEEITRLAAARVMVIAGSAMRNVATKITSGLPVAVRWNTVVEHIPVELAGRARAAANEVRADVLVPIGGGSTIGLAKAVALSTRVPILAVPTTYAGSEATPVWGLTEGREKRTGVDPGVLPVSVVYDSTLTLTLPVEVSVASGLNGLAHCVDSMWAPHTDPINQALALEGIRTLAAGLPKVVSEPDGIRGRDQSLYGAYLAATAFASAGSGLHHKICHVLGGAYNLPHAATHAIILPYVLALNGPAVPDAAARLATALGAPGDDPVDALERLRRDLDAPHALREIGLREEDVLDAAARIADVVPESNPAPTPPDVLEALLRAAWAGDVPNRAQRGKS